MSLISIRLPDSLDARLSREAKQSRLPKSELARDAIAAYLSQRERQRFIDEIARAARASSGEDPLAVAEEALRLDNEALAIGESTVARESRPRYRRPRKKA
jgi:predicted transcriptional regulator